MRKGKSFVCGNMRGWTREEQALVRVVDELDFDDDGTTAKVISIKRQWTTNSLEQLDGGGISVFKEAKSFEPMKHIRIEHLEHKTWELLEALSNGPNVNDRTEDWNYPDMLRREITAVEELLDERLQYEKSKFEEDYKLGCYEVEQREEESIRSFRETHDDKGQPLGGWGARRERRKAALEGAMGL